MDFNSLKQKGEKMFGGKDGKIDYADLQKDGKSAYDTYNKTEGSFSDKAQAAYKGYSKDHAGDKTESKTEETKK